MRCSLASDFLARVTFSFSTTSAIQDSDVAFCESTVSFEYSRRWKNPRSPDRSASNTVTVTMVVESKHQSAIFVGSCRPIPVHFTGSARIGWKAPTLVLVELRRAEMKTPEMVSLTSVNALPTPRVTH